jgi:hypothetical protein
VLPAINALKEKINISSDQDLIVVALHAIMSLSGFMLIGLGESENYIENNQIPPEWNNSQESWSFRYRHPKSTNTYVLKALKLGKKLLVHTMILDKDIFFDMEIVVEDFIKKLDLPNTSDISLKYTNVGQFIDNFIAKIASKILSDVDFEINAKLNPSLSQGNNKNEPGYDPLRIGGEHRAPGNIPYGQPHYGDPDLYPLGQFGVIPNYPGGGGNLMGPGHPMFNIGPQRGGTYPPMHPRGGRFDPFGPPNVGIPQNPRPDHFRPPDGDDFNNMFG